MCVHIYIHILNYIDIRLLCIFETSVLVLRVTQPEAAGVFGQAPTSDIGLQKVIGETRGCTDCGFGATNLGSFGRDRPCPTSIRVADLVEANFASAFAPKRTRPGAISSISWPENQPNGRRPPTEPPGHTPSPSKKRIKPQSP